MPSVVLWKKKHYLIKSSELRQNNSYYDSHWTKLRVSWTLASIYHLKTQSFHWIQIIKSEEWKIQLTQTELYHTNYSFSIRFLSFHSHFNWNQNFLIANSKFVLALSLLSFQNLLTEFVELNQYNNFHPHTGSSEMSYKFANHGIEIMSTATKTKRFRVGISFPFSMRKNTAVVAFLSFFLIFHLSKQNENAKIS